MSELDISTRIEEMRAQFDRTFAALPERRSETLVDLLAIRVAGVPYALRGLEIAQIIAEARVTPLPSPVPELIGLCAVRGVVVPVYDLAGLLGHVQNERPRYVALVAVGQHELIGLAFEGLDAQLRVSEEEIAQPQEASKGTAAARYAVLTLDVVRPVIQLASVLESIERRIQQEP